MGSLRRAWCGWLILPLILLGCVDGEPNAPGVCTLDEACPAGRRCAEGVCIPQQRPQACADNDAGNASDCGLFCREDLDCPNGRCVDGECFEDQCLDGDTMECPGSCGEMRTCLNGVWRPCPPESDLMCPDGGIPIDATIDAQTLDMVIPDVGEVDQFIVDAAPMDELDADIPLPEPPANDRCEDAIELIAEEQQVAMGDTTNAEIDPGPGPDIWYRFRVNEPIDFEAQLRAEGPWDTHLALLSGSCLRLTPVVENDDFDGRTDSQITRNNLGRGVYFLQVSGAGVTEFGPFELSLRFTQIIPPPINDQCEGAIELPAGIDIEVIGDTTGALRDYGVNFRGPDIWYQTQIEEPIDLSIEVQGQDEWDTYLYLLQGRCNALNAVASNDDDPRVGRSAIEEEALEPGRYFIVVGGFNENAFGAFEMSLDYTPSTRVNEATLMATHNSYSGDARRSIIAQLDHGVRSIELDVHDDSYEQVGDYRVGHDRPGDEVMRGNGNPDTLALNEWLETIDAWSEANPRHAPLFLVLDLKDDVTDNRSHGQGNLGALNHRIESIFGQKIFEADEVGARGTPWPAIARLRGRIIVILSGDEGSRRAYESDEGHHAAIAVNSRGQVVEVHDNGDDWVWYWTGQYQADGKIQWTSHARYARGQRPAVDLNDNGTIVTVFEDDGFDGLVVMVGSIRADGTGIDFGEEERYDRGVLPSLRFTGQNRVREIHQSQNNNQRWFWDGQVDEANRRIDWNDDTHDRTEQAFYDRAIDTARINNRLRRVEVRTRAGDNQLRYGTDQFEDEPIRYASKAFVEAQPGDEDWIHPRIHFFASEADGNNNLNFIRLWGGRGGITRQWGYNQAQARRPNHPATDEPFAQWYIDHLEALGAIE